MHPMTIDPVTPQNPSTLISSVLFMFMPKMPMDSISSSRFTSYLQENGMRQGKGQKKVHRVYMFGQKLGGTDNRWLAEEGYR